MGGEDKEINEEINEEKDGEVEPRRGTANVNCLDISLFKKSFVGACN